jgi:signal transduction histidine kinase
MPLNESERGELREALHKMNNALNSISMQAELAKLYTEQNENEKIQEALEIIMSQCRQCSSVTQSTRSLVDEPG